MADLSMVLVRRDAPLDVAKLVAAAERVGIPLEPQRGTRDGATLAFRLRNDASFLVARMSAPHPDAPHMPTGVTSPQAAEIRACRAHLVVTALGLDGDERDRDLQMAALTACAIAASDAVGAMLGHGVVFHEAALFAELAALGAESGELPAELAIDVTAAPEPGERMSFLTHGLRRYGREEFFVTCPVSGRGALDFVYALSRWMLRDPDKQLPTGDTVGRTASEKVRVQRVKSPAGTGEVVIRLDLPG